VIELRKWRRAKAVAAGSEGSEVTSSLDESAANSGDRLSKEGRADKDRGSEEWHRQSGCPNGLAMRCD
jgi:hypothetical protein